MITDGNYINNFWKPVDIYNTTSSGADSHSLKSWNQKNPAFDKWLKCVREQISLLEGCGEIPPLDTFTGEYGKIVKKALFNVKNNMCGHLYTLQQVVDFLRILPDTIIFENEGVYVAKP